MKTTYLALSSSISRGRDTFGYNIVRLDDTSTDKRYKCMGGGYDMTGTVVAKWLEDIYQERLQAAGEAVTSLYGAQKRADGRVSIDGGCGIESVGKIAETIGLSFQSHYSTRKRATIGYTVTDTI